MRPLRGLLCARVYAFSVVCDTVYNVAPGKHVHRHGCNNEPHLAR